jgi:ferredoxin-NADP reductase
MWTRVGSILIVGGIGVTPILSHTANWRDEAGRSRSITVRIAVSGWPFAMRWKLFGGRAFYCISSESGRMDVAAVLKSSPAESHIHVCGTLGLWIQSVKPLDSGLKVDQIHFESFGALWIATDESVYLELTLSGLTLDVAVGQTLLEAIEAAGVQVPYDRRRGECHMCATQVVEGKPATPTTASHRRELPQGRLGRRPWGNGMQQRW